MKLSIKLFLAIFSILFVFSCAKKEETKLSEEQSTALYYLYNKSLISDTFSRILFNIPVDCRGLNSEEQKLYFIFKKEVGRANVLKSVVLDSNLVEFAPSDTGEINFGGLEGRIDGFLAYKTPVKNIKIDANQVFTCNLATKKYNVSFSDLSKSMDSNTCYNTPKLMIIQDNFEKHKMANIGSYISLKGKDPITKKLAQELTAGLTTNEEKAQKLLDFVSKEITYSYEDYWYQSEITKRAHEVLISGDGDCSGKTTLYASLLEECNIPYCILYFDRHVNVGVLGNFKSNNKYSFKIKNDTYYMAETTVPNFIIGESLISNAEILNNVLIYQIPKQSQNAYWAKNNQTLPLMNEEEEYIEVEE